MKPKPLSAKYEVKELEILLIHKESLVDIGLYWELTEQLQSLLEKEREGVMNEAIAIFAKLPEGEIMTKNPVILELKVLRDFKSKGEEK